MKAHLEFDLSKKRDKQLHEQCLKAEDVYQSLIDFDQWLFQRIHEWPMSASNELLDIVKVIRDQFNSHMDRYGIELYNETTTTTVNQDKEVASCHPIPGKKPKRKAASAYGSTPQWPPT